MAMRPTDLPPDSLRPIIAPLERLTLPAHLDGSALPRGNETFPLRIEARNDLEAIQMWLAEVATGVACFRSYRLEAERCLLWATVERGKPLTALSDADIHDYAHFLLYPHPRERWLSEGKGRRVDDSWRPFKRPLSPRSSARALAIISSFFAWLEQGGYLPENPWRDYDLASRHSERKNLAPAMVVERQANVATVIEWSYVRKAIYELETNRDGLHVQRAKTALYLAYFADMKPGEICSLQTSSIGVLSSGVTPVWQLDIKSRPAKIREIILLPPAQQALEKYLGRRGLLDGAGTPTSNCPVMVCSRGSRDEPEEEAILSDRRAPSSTKHVFLRAAELARCSGDVTAARRLSGASINWLKHAFEIHASQMIRSGNACWFLMGSSWLAGPAFKEYLPARTPLSVSSAMEAFEGLRDMWEEKGNDPD